MKIRSYSGFVCLAGSVLLSGCINTAAYRAPVVEDRSTNYSDRVGSNGVVTPVDPYANVSVTPVAPTPVFRPQKGQQGSVDNGQYQQNPYEQPEQQIKPQPMPRVPNPVQRTVQKPAVVALLNTSERQVNAGQYRAAQSNLQRALRISPKDPEVYRALADTHRHVGEYLQAEQVALKGVAVAQGQPQKLYRLWTLIASIRNQSGDSEGASNALAVARRYQ